MADCKKQMLAEVLSAPDENLPRVTAVLAVFAVERLGQILAVLKDIRGEGVWPEDEK